MSDADISFHVNDQKHDFAKWLEGVISKEFSEKLKKAKTKDQLIPILEDSMK